MNANVNYPARLACFVTGTDTDVGKTHATVALLHALHGRGYSTAGMKPVAAGGVWRNGRWQNYDVEQLRQASSVSVPLEQMCPFFLRTPVAPHLAAELEDVHITCAPIREAFDALRQRATAVVVEGVGGFAVPLAAGTMRWSTADLAEILNLPMIMVVGLRLGCLNHALLTAEAIRARGLTLAGWIANRLDPGMLMPTGNILTLQDALDAPLLGELPWQVAPSSAAQYLDLAPLLACTSSAALGSTIGAHRA